MTLAVEIAESLLTPGELIARLGVAAVLGGVLGLEREAHEKPAGLRTHMLVALGAACFSLAAFGLVRDAASGALDVSSPLQIDPTRVMEGVVGGIGFLGAGAILRRRGEVEGLTTAGSLWLSGALGIASGAGEFWLAGITAVLAAVILAVLGWVEHKVRGGRRRPSRPPSGPER